MQITLPDDARQLSLAAGYASVEQYILSLVQRDRERLAIEEGITALKEGMAQDFSEFDRQFREQNSLSE